MRPFDRPVILDDQRDPNISWQHHRARGSAGGVDLAYPDGTPVYATADGTGSWSWQGTGGRTYDLATSIGTIVYMHLSRIVKTGPVREGDLIAYSGTSGNGRDGYYAPHLHVHLNRGNIRLNLFDFLDLTPAPTPAPAPKPIPYYTKHKKDTEMFSAIRRVSNGSIWLINAETGERRALSLGEWMGYAVNGFKYTDLTDEQFDRAVAATKEKK